MKELKKFDYSALDSQTVKNVEKSDSNLFKTLLYQDKDKKIITCDNFRDLLNEEGYYPIDIYYKNSNKYEERYITLLNETPSIEELPSSEEKIDYAYTTFVDFYKGRATLDQIDSKMFLDDRFVNFVEQMVSEALYQKYNKKDNFKKIRSGLYKKKLTEALEYIQDVKDQKLKEIDERE